MSYRTAALFTTLLLAGLVNSSDANDGLLGNWMGELQIPDGPSLNIGMELFERADGSIGANASSPDQGARYMRVEKLDVSDREFTAAIAGMPVVISGQLNDSGELAGQFRQGDGSLPLNFSRIEAIPETVRPQESSLSHQLVEREVRYYNRDDETWLSATLTIPYSASKETPVPAVLLLAGSGPTERDEHHSGHRPLKVLAHYLTEQGFAVLRADKRGVLKSSGDFASADLQDFANDAMVGIEFMMTFKGIDADRVGMIGHSEGSLVAAMVAAEIPNIAFVVSLAGPGQTVLEVLVNQDGTEPMAAGATEQDAVILREFSRRFYQTALESENETERQERLQALYDNLKEDEEKTINQWNRRQGTLNVEYASRDSFVEFLQSDPKAHWQNVTQSTLLIGGENDVQVATHENLQIIESTLNKHGNKNVTARIFPSVNHMMQTSETGALEEYGQIEESFSPRVMAYIASWLQGQVKFL